MVQYRVAFRSFKRVTDSLDLFTSPIYLLVSTIVEEHELK